MSNTDPESTVPSAEPGGGGAGLRPAGADAGEGRADPLERASELLEQIEAARAKLEQMEDPDAAVDVLAEITELAKEAHAEIERARREHDAHP
jgi:hypothetical protein